MPVDPRVLAAIANPTGGRMTDVAQDVVATKAVTERTKMMQNAQNLDNLKAVLPIAQTTSAYTNSVLDSWDGDLNTWDAHKKSVYNSMDEGVRSFLPDPEVDKLTPEQFQSTYERANETIAMLGEDAEKYSEFGEIEPGWMGQVEKTTGEAINVKRKEQQALVENVIGDKALPKVVETLARKIIQEDMPVAEGALQGLGVTNELVGLLDEGMFTGTAAQFQTWMGGALQKAGFLQSDDRIENTQAYAAYAGKLVAQIIKEFGAGTGLSDADREYAEKIAGGKIALTEDALRKLHMLNVKYSRMGIEKYNTNVQRLPKEIRDEMDLSIEMPEAYSWESPDEVTNQGYSDEDLEYTAEKYGITIDEVKERLRNAE